MRTYGEPTAQERRQGMMIPYQLVALSPWLLALFLGLRFSSEPSTEQLLQQGHQAMVRGDYETAAAFYAKAELHSTDPEEVAFYLAGAKYQLALKTEGLSPELLEVEQLYRCCLNPSDPRRARALCGLGNCLLHKAGSSDEGSLRSAVACYDLCLQSTGDDEVLVSAARFNREKARLLLLQFVPPLSDSPRDRPPRDDMNPHLPRPYERNFAMPVQTNDAGAEGNVDPQAVPGDTKQEQAKEAAKNNEPPQPGKGNLPPIPDQVDVPPLSPQVAVEHLELAARKVQQERRSHHRRAEETTAKDVKDW